MAAVIHVTNAPADQYRPSGSPPGWEVPLTPDMGVLLPDDPVRIRRGRTAAVPGRVYAVNYANNTLFVELLEEEKKTDE